MTTSNAPWNRRGARAMRDADDNQGHGDPAVIWPFFDLIVASAIVGLIAWAVEVFV
jgi:hypothetical protein